MLDQRAFFTVTVAGTASDRIASKPATHVRTVSGGKESVGVSHPTRLEMVSRNRRLDRVQLGVLVVRFAVVPTRGLSL